MKQIVDGNKAASKIAYLFSEVASIYPITPSSPMASNVDYLAHHNAYNLFSDRVRVLEMQSEAGAAGAMHGALISGSLATTFTASQGLLLMIPNMYKIAGEMLPGVIHVASRTIATHALSIFGDHSDVYATRGTGFCILASSSVFDAQNLAAVAHLSAMKSSIPFLHFFDGFRTSHELNTIESLREEDLLKLVPWDEVVKFQSRSLNVGNPIQRGLAENEDIYFQSMEARNGDYLKVPEIVDHYMQEINQLLSTDYAPFVYYGSEDATDIIVAMGSVSKTIRLVVDEELKQGKKVGMIEVHLYRPFSVEYLKKVLPVSVERIAVLDRTKEQGSVGEPLYLDVVSALQDLDLKIVGGRYGLASKNTTPAHIKSVFEMLESHPKHNFTIGIQDDLTYHSLPFDDTYHISLNAKEVKIYGFGSDGMVGASKDLLHIVGEQENFYVQGYFEYDSKKSGGVTVSNLRFANHPIEAPYYVTEPDIIVVTKVEYFEKFRILENVKENAILMVNSSDDHLFLQKLSKQDQEIILNRHIEIKAIDAESIAEEYHLNGKINKVMEVILLSFLGYQDAVSLVSKTIQEEFATKGQEIVEQNIAALKDVFSRLHTVDISSFSPFQMRQEGATVMEKINERFGNTLSVSDLYPYRDGTFPGGFTRKEKRNVSLKVAKWVPENCIQCGMCSFVCPHAVIRPFITVDNGIPALGTNGKYAILVSEADCTGCGLCVDICPGKKGEKALQMGTYDPHQQEISDIYFDQKNPDVLPLTTIKNSQFRTPRFEFSGACAGCGETPYLKLLTQLFQDKLILANATGCSSIYGGSVPSTPYTLPWANSLFEDNAEFAYGMHLSYLQKREQILKIMEVSFESVSKEIQDLYTQFKENFNNYEITCELKQKFANLEIPKDLKLLLPYVPARTVWAIGGDGWAYDIGFGGIDHVLSSQENIKILVLDTEVYSNTGGQMSKSSRIGQVSEFADFGKRSYKKDMFRIAMSYPNCYVASINLGANMLHTLKVLKEAEEHQGPSIILAYSTCIEHGIKGGMTCSLREQKLAVDVGYSLLMRYLPKEQKLYLDSKTPDFDRYEEFLEHEIRYRALKIKNESLAHELLSENKKQAIRRYQYYQKLSEN